MSTIDEFDDIISSNPLFQTGINIDMAFSYETRRWDTQLKVEATISSGLEETKISKLSNSISLSQVLDLFKDDPKKAYEKEIAVETMVMLGSLIRAIQKHLEHQGLLMSDRDFNDFYKEKLDRYETQKR